MGPERPPHLRTGVATGGTTSSLRRSYQLQQSIALQVLARPLTTKRQAERPVKPANLLPKSARGGNVVEVRNSEASEGGLSRHWDGGYRDRRPVAVVHWHVGVGNLEACGCRPVRGIACHRLGLCSRDVDGAYIVAYRLVAFGIVKFGRGETFDLGTTFNTKYQLHNTLLQPLGLTYLVQYDMVPLAHQHLS